LLPLVFYVLFVFAQYLVYNVSCIYGLSILRCPLCSMFCLSLLYVLCILFHAKDKQNIEHKGQRRMDSP
jgi:hypothetical protein